MNQKKIAEKKEDKIGVDLIPLQSMNFRKQMSLSREPYDLDDDSFKLKDA